MLKVIEASIFISFIIGLVGGKLLIPVLKRAKFGQYIREEGPKAHQSKTGTPTMGGVIFLIGLPITVIIEYFLFDVKKNLFQGQEKCQLNRQKV